MSRTVDVAIYDLPDGGFLVLEHIAHVWIDEPHYVIQGPVRASFLVLARTTQGADVVCGRFVAVERPEWECTAFPDTKSAHFRMAQAGASALVADLRAALVEVASR